MIASHPCGQRKHIISSLYESTEMFSLRPSTSDWDSSFQGQTFAFIEYIIFYTAWNFLLPFTGLVLAKGHHCCCINTQLLVAGL